MLSTSEECSSLGVEYGVWSSEQIVQLLIVPLLTTVHCRTPRVLVIFFLLNRRKTYSKATLVGRLTQGLTCTGVNYFAK